MAASSIMADRLFSARVVIVRPLPFIENVSGRGAGAPPSPGRRQVICDWDEMKGRMERKRAGAVTHPRPELTAPYPYESAKV
jgi:hypothetical protein